MFARIFRGNLKPGEGPAYSRAIQEVVPMLRKCAGFRDEIAMVSSDGKQAIGISFWDRREDAEAYVKAVYPDVLKILQKHLDGVPTVIDHDVTYSTAHAIQAMKA